MWHFDSETYKHLKSLKWRIHYMVPAFSRHVNSSDIVKFEVFEDAKYSREDVKARVAILAAEDA